MAVATSADLLRNALKRHRSYLARSLEQMESGKMTAATQGRDTTLETMSQLQIWIAQIDSALAASPDPSSGRRGRQS